ncbi:MAG: hypothetical protein QOJ16_1412 [Acidobacteriota bacterium]|jgi:hypothetical protein|nr:hypothetical protein [Acidobacteriota bacterium]
MKDLDSLGGILFFSLFVLAIVIAVLGISVLLRLARARETPSGGPPWVLLATLALLGVAWMAIFLPYLSVLPALVFFVLGARALIGGKGFSREGGAVMLLVGLGWAIYTAYQVVMAAWSLTVSGPIRVDILIVVPIMGVISFIGGKVPGSLSAFRADAVRPSVRTGDSEDR